MDSHPAFLFANEWLKALLRIPICSFLSILSNWSSYYYHIKKIKKMKKKKKKKKRKKQLASYHTQKKKHHFLFTITYLLVICRWSLISQQSSYSVMSQRKQRKILLNLLLTSCKDLCRSLSISLELPIIDVYK